MWNIIKNMSRVSNQIIKAHCSIKVITFIIGLLFTLQAPRLFSQEMSIDELYAYQENLVFELNNEILVPGENLLIALRCYQGRQPSYLSKVAYIEIINSAKVPVLRQQVTLKQGLGSAILYLPSYLKTGSYTLIAYTRWMKNFSRSTIHQTSIRIINPYENLPAHLFEPQDDLKPTATFFPEGGHYILNRSQKVSVLVLDQFGRGVPVQGRLTSNDGVVVAEFESTASGESGFYFMPSQTNGYRLIMVDRDENVHFQELELSPVGKTAITVAETENHYILTNDTKSSSSKLLVAEFWHGGYLKDKKAFTDNSLSVSKSELPKGVSILRVADSTGLLYFEQALYTIPQKVTAQVALGSKNIRIRKRVSLSIIPDTSIGGGFVTISVKKKIPGEKLKSHLEDVYGTSSITLGDHQKNAAVPSTVALMRQKSPLVEGASFLIEYLPDFRGSLVTGRVIDDNSQPVSGQQVSLTRSEDLKFSLTNDEGRFYFHVDSRPYEEEYFVSGGSPGGGVNLYIDNPFLKDHSFVDISPFVSDRLKEDWLIQKSIEVQVENAYYQVKNDSLGVETHREIFAYLRPKTYIMDDFTRFPKMEDPIQEYVEEVSLRKNNGNARFILPYVNNKSGFIDSTLTLLNGIPVTPQFILNLNPLDIERIEVYEKQVNIGSAEFRGVIDFISYKDRFENISPGNRFKKIDYQSTIDYQKVSGPVYDSDTLRRIPDFRSQLLWEPHLEIGEDPLVTEFYTSDSPGTYEVIVSGVLDHGGYIYEIMDFEVKE
ncbi:MAG: carboxypeptidase-like regulatory domain-containing protein [Cyclobacteriaceae bacterium]